MLAAARGIEGWQLVKSKTSGVGAIEREGKPLAKDAEIISVTESFLLMSLSCDSGVPAALPYMAHDIGLAGAILIDLLLDRRIRFQRDHVELISRQPTGHGFLNQALQELHRAGEPLNLGQGLELLAEDASNLQYAAFQHLTDLGLVSIKCRLLASGFEAHSFPYTKNGEKRSLIARISLNEVLDLRDVLAGNVADACGLFDVVLRKKHRKQLTNRIHQLIGTDYVGEEVIEMVEATSQVGYHPARGLAPTAANKRVQKNEKTNTWEWRAFWSDQAPVVTPSYGVALDSSVEFKTTNVSDRYLLIPGQRDNIKMRKHGLEVKQLIESHRHYEAFRPKEVFKFPIEVGDLTRVFPRLYGGLDKVVNENEFEAVLQTYGYAPSHVKVKKLRNRMRLADDVQLELCRFTLKRRTYWSACVEGPDLSCVRTCVHTINPQAGRVMGYMEFLDQVVREQ